MSSITRLNSKEKKQFLQQLQNQYGYEKGLTQDILVNKNKGRYYLVTPELLEFDFEEQRVETIGMYFATLVSPNDLRLTIEGSQIIGPYATKNVHAIDDEETKQWIRGQNLSIETELAGWLILKHESDKGVDYLGCGKIVQKNDEQVIHNYIPKTRYVRSVIE